MLTLTQFQSAAVWLLPPFRSLGLLNLSDMAPSMLLSVASLQSIFRRTDSVVERIRKYKHGITASSIQLNKTYLVQLTYDCRHNII